MLSDKVLVEANGGILGIIVLFIQVVLVLDRGNELRSYSRGTLLLLLPEFAFFVSVAGCILCSV